MKTLEFYDSSSSVYPDVIDDTSSPHYVYVRKDIEEITVEDIGGNESTMYAYKEMVLTRPEYELYTKITELQALQDYLAMMTDVELPVGGEDE